MSLLGWFRPDLPSSPALETGQPAPQPSPKGKRKMRKCPECQEFFSAFRELEGCEDHDGGLPAKTVTGRPPLVDWRRNLKKEAG